MKRADAGQQAGEVSIISPAGRRRAVSLVRLLCCIPLLALGYGLITGCAAGTGFSGGSVPVGVRSTTIQGKVVFANSISSMVPNASIQVTSTFVPSRAELRDGTGTAGAASGTGSGVPGTVSATYTQAVQADGTFILGGIQTGTGTATITMVVTAAQSNVAPLTLTFTMHAGDLARVVASMASGAVTTTTPGSIELSPSSATVAEGDGQQFTAGLYQSGTLIPVSPSLVMVGSNTDLGTITPGGDFTATAPGEGTLTAFWYGGVASSPAYIDVISPANATGTQQ